MTERPSWLPFSPLFITRRSAGSRLALGVALFGSRSRF